MASHDWSCSNSLAHLPAGSSRREFLYWGLVGGLGLTIGNSISCRGKSREITALPAVPAKRLKARWIWTSDNLPPRNQFVLFRKVFPLESRLNEALCSITAERSYQLWVNGIWVGEGPAVGHPYEKSCDVYDVASLLHPGPNSIAVVVQFDGDLNMGGAHTRWQVPPTRGGLLCQLDGRASGNVVCVASDKSWAARPARGWHNHTQFMNDLYYQEVYRMGRDPARWQTAEFDHTGWPAALALGTTGGQGPDGRPLPWRKVIPRDFPPLTRQRHLPVQVLAGEVIQRMESGDGPQEGDQPYFDVGLPLTLEPFVPLNKGRVEGEANLILGKDACVLCNSDPLESVDTHDGLHDATVILDFGQLRNARLLLEVDGQDLACLDIGYGPNLVDGRVSPYRSTRTSWADRVALTAGKQSWRSFFWRQFRFVQITLRNTSAPVHLLNVTAEGVTQTWNSTATFHCPDPELVTFWRFAERTAELCTLDRLMDNGSRECRNQPIDIAPLSALHGDSPFYYWYLRQLALAQLPTGMFMDTCPGKGSPTEIGHDAGFRIVQIMWDQYVRFGPRSLLEEYSDPVRHHLAFWGRIANQRGLLSVEEAHAVINTGFQLWFDDANIDRRGEQLVLNALYLQNIRVGSEMARILGDQKSADDYARKATSIGQVLRDEFWDNKRGVFVDALVDGKQSPMTSEHGNGLMLYLGLASPEQAERILRAWQHSPNELTEADVGFLHPFILEGLVKYGYSAFALRLLRRLRRHLRPGQETFGEVWTLKGSQISGEWHTANSRAVAQGCASWPVAFLLDHIVGLQPRWGLEGALRLAPQPLVDSAEAEWCGIRVAWEKQADAWHISAQFPQPTTLQFVLPFPLNVMRSLTINGQPTPVQAVVRLESLTELDARVTV